MQRSYMQLAASVNLVGLAQSVEQRTGNLETGAGSSPLSNHLIFGCLRNSC